MRRWFSYSSVFALIGANLVPLAGVVFGGWTVFSVVFIFWMENIVIGILNLVKLFVRGCHVLLVPEPMPGVRVPRWAHAVFTLVGTVFYSIFFTIHYGGFAAIHGLFVVALLGRGNAFGGEAVPAAGMREAIQRVIESDMRWALLGLLISHVYSFVANYIGRKEYQRIDVETLMMGPYGRVAVLHVTIIFGAFAAALLGSPMGVLAVLVVLKMGMDIRAHVREREKAARPPSSPPVAGDE